MTQKILAISGSDILSGGGMQADLAVFTNQGLQGFVVLTCLTTIIDNRLSVHALDADLVRDQLASVADVPFSAVKIGLLPNLAIAQLVLDFVKELSVPIVLDPVLVFKENDDQTVASTLEMMQAFYPYITILTPNLSEASLLIHQPLTSLEDMLTASSSLCRQGVKAVLIKGGERLAANQAVDVFCEDGLAPSIYQSPLLQSINTGAGCTLSSAVASYLAKGESLSVATQHAKDYTHCAIAHATEYGVFYD